MDINARFKQVRLELAMGQEEFGSEIGLSKSGISNIENGVRKVTDKHIKLVCAIFNVNEAWLRNGEGEMFNRTESNAIDQLCSDMNAGETETALLREVLQYYFKIDPKIRDAFARHALDIAKSKAAPVAQPPPPPEPAAPDVMSMLAEMKEALAETRRENAELKKRIAGIEEFDKLSLIASGSFDSIPDSSGSSDTETTEEVGKQKTAHQHDH